MREICAKIKGKYDDLISRKRKLEEGLKTKSIDELDIRELKSLETNLTSIEAKAYEVLRDLYSGLGVDDACKYFNSREISDSDKKERLFNFLNIYRFFIGKPDSLVKKIKGSSNGSDFINDFHFEHERHLNSYLQDEEISPGKSLMGSDTYKHAVNQKTNMRRDEIDDYLIFHFMQQVEFSTFTAGKKKEIFVDAILDYFLTDAKILEFKHFNDLIPALNKEPFNSETTKKVAGCVSFFFKRLTEYKERGEREDKITETKSKGQIKMEIFSILSEMMMNLGPENRSEILNILKRKIIPKDKSNILIDAKNFEYIECLVFMYYLQGDFKQAKKYSNYIMDEDFFSIPESDLILKKPGEYIKKYNPASGNLNSIVNNMILSGYYEMKAQAARHKLLDRKSI